MRIFPKLSVLCTFLAASGFVFLAVAAAQDEPNMVAAPFIAAESPTSKNFLASIVSTGKRNPFLVATNSSGIPFGTYPGVILKSDDENTSFCGLDTLSFSCKGPATIETMVEFTAPGRSFQRAFARIQPKSAVKGDFTKVVLTSEQLGMPKNSSLNKIVLAQSKLGSKGRFQVDDILLNGNPIKKTMNTLFFGVDQGSPSGPLGNIAQSTVTGTNTGLKIENRYQSAVTMFMQLQPISGCSAPTDVQAVFPSMTYVNPVISKSLGYVTLGIKGSGTSSLTTSYQGPISANFSVGSFNQLCGTNIVPTGVNLAEVTLNDGCQGAFAQETMDISLINGMNAIFQMASSGPTPFTTVINTKPVPPTIASVTKFQNTSPFSTNLNLPGVFPYGCTNCSNNSGAFVCPPPGPPIAPATYWTNPPKPYGACNKTSFLGCNLSRSPANSGGTITITYMRPSN